MKKKKFPNFHSVNHTENYCVFLYIFFSISYKNLESFIQLVFYFYVMQKKHIFNLLILKLLHLSALLIFLINKRQIINVYVLREFLVMVYETMYGVNKFYSQGVNNLCLKLYLQATMCGGGRKIKINVVLKHF